MFLDGVDRGTGALNVASQETEAFLAIMEPLQKELGADMSMISFLSETHHHVVVSKGIDLPQEAAGRMTLEHSICLHATEMDFPLVVDNALAHPLLRGNLSVEDFGVAAYLGAPIHLPGQGAAGTICVMHLRPRRWDSNEIDRVLAAANEVNTLLETWERAR